MQINKFIQDATSRYSYHFIAWIFPFILLTSLLIIYFLWLYFAKKIDVGTGQTIAWLLILFVLPIIMPCIALTYILILSSIRYYEKININFRLKNNIFNNNLFLKMVFLFLFVIGIMLYLLLICYTTYMISISDSYKHIFFTIGIPVMISILPINLFFYKFLHNKALHKK